MDGWMEEWVEGRVGTQHHIFRTANAPADVQSELNAEEREGVVTSESLAQHDGGRMWGGE